MLGRSLGFERLVKQVDRNLQIDDYNDLHEYDDKILIKRKTFNPGDKVLRVRHNKHAKLDSNYKPEVLTVVSYFNDGTCQLADAHGRLLKRRLNVASLRQFYQRE
ncbi:hypothetical protein BD770DRAFT_334691 [Pilaira anomala]|nr:hypothetical protein BD770DRAFT_334691 [Pilaira anomala]